MEIRTAKGNDADDIAQAARASLSESYSHFVGDATIDEMVEQWYAPDRIRELLDDDHVVFDVVEEDDEVVGFAQGRHRRDGADRRRDSLAPRRPGRTRGRDRRPASWATSRRRSRTARPPSSAGSSSKRTRRGRGSTPTTASRTHGGDVDRIGDQEFDEIVFEKQLGDEPAEQVLEAITGPDDRELFVNFSEGERGAPRAVPHPFSGLRS